MQRFPFVYFSKLQNATVISGCFPGPPPLPDFPTRLAVSYNLSGALTGFVVGLAGVGAGALMMPLLLLLGVNPVTAVATDLWFAALNKTVAAGIHGRAGQIDWGVVRRLWLGSLPVAVAVVLLVSLGARLQKLDWLGSAIGLWCC